MLSIYDYGEKYPITGYSNFYIKHVDGGEDTLAFTVKTDSEIYKHIAEENRVEYRDVYYRVKSIDAPSTYANVSCTVDLNFLKANFHKTYDSDSLSLFALLQTLLPSGWTIKGYDPGIRRTLHMENATDYDIVKQAMSTYSVAYEWHTKAQTLVILNPNDTTPSGEYLTDQLNLRSIAYKGKSTDFCTRLYPYGKDGLTIASVNNGKEYIENHQYSNEIICGYWKDERYTVPEDLKAAAEERLRTLSVPARSYECDVIDLAKLDEKYKDFQFSMYKVVTLIDRQRHVRINHQIMEYKEYPDEPQKNELTLSTVLKGVKTQLSEAIATVQDTVNEQRNVQTQFSNLMANALGYYHTEQKDEQGRTTTYIHDKPLLSESSTIWKVSVQGFAVSLDGGKTWSGGFTAGTTLVARLIQTDRIESLSNPNVFLDLANGIIATSRLVASDNSEIYADVGTEEPQYGSAQGLFLYHGAGADTKFAQIYRMSDSRHDGAQLLSLGPLSFVSNAGMGGKHVNSAGFNKDSNDYGTFVLRLATPTGDNIICLADSYGTGIYGALRVLLQTMSGKGWINVKDDEIEFGTNGEYRGSIDATGFHGWINGHEGIDADITDKNGHVWHFQGGILTGVD
jgi:phage minor structural protein